ncbi:transcriptional regulator, SARP family [Stackebrandtia nassauensis DSM 44728]|uniref:Transcriptional regulator, SARP family n=1 Tax=Stackebrandtia nassauensis (strain DSM 44728 / CIP 108903 / NRRL B-16338 / NBRC 102104 / LLR-40K-21) TaxID=446470 RepID=D3Q901_STANL|nr:transcriptional regulator, SARP family [Stackebrandtia nassauensis DSM 44728]
MLAILAARVGAVVSIAHLTEQLWRDDPPQRARATLYSYLSRLRKIFAATAVSIRRRSGGYLLEADPLTVDVNRFRELVSRARDGGDLADWDAAMALWRGEPFAELDVPELDNLRTTLDAEHFAAVLDRNDALLRRGEHTRALPELHELAERSPWDERLAGQLMLALYRCGRPSEALDHYRRLSTRLITERGVEPGPELSALHREILNDAPSLRASSPDERDGGPVPVPPRDRTTVTPRQLPGDMPGFTGRQTHLDQLDRLLAGGDRTIVVSGTAGVGKTSLAVHWAHRVAERFGEGQLYLNLRGFDPEAEPLSAADAILAFLDALGVPGPRVPPGIEAQTALYRSLVAERELLVLLDNARDAEQVRPLLPGGDRCLTLVTSRNRLAGLVATEGARPVALGEMSELEARVLLRARLGSERVDAETEVVTALIQHCGGLPLALSIAAARAEVDPAASLAPLLRQLATAGGDFLTLDDADPKTSVRSVFSWSYRCLSPEAARLFRRLGIHPGPSVSVTAAASLLGESVDGTLSSLEELVRAHLIDRDPSGRFTFHDLLRDYARELAADTDPEPDRHAAVTRLLDQYLHGARAAWMLWDNRRSAYRLPEPAPGTTLDAMSTAEDGQAWFNAEETVLIGLVMLAHRDGHDAHAYRMVRAMERPLEWRGRWIAWLTCQHIALKAATRCGDLAAQSHVHMFLGHADLRRGRYPEAEDHFERAIELSAEVDDHYGLAQAHVGLGMTFKRQDKIDLALEHEYRVCEIYEAEGGVEPGYLFALNNLGRTLALHGDHAEALRRCERALELGVEHANRRAIASALDNLGFVHAQRGDSRTAIGYYERAVAAEREFGNAFNEARTLMSYGDVLCEAGETTAAVDRYRRAVAIFDRLDPDGSQEADEARAKLNLLGGGTDDPVLETATGGESR